jgi:hypothetical protein
MALYNGVMVSCLSGSAVSWQVFRVLNREQPWFDTSVVQFRLPKTFVGWLTVRGGRLLVMVVLQLVLNCIRFNS